MGFGWLPLLRRHEWVLGGCREWWLLWWLPWVWLECEKKYIKKELFYNILI